MKIIKYNSIEEVKKKACELRRVVFDSGVSVSFRIFDKQGKKTLELHIFYY